MRHRHDDSIRSTELNDWANLVIDTTALHQGLAVVTRATAGHKRAHVAPLNPGADPAV